MSVPTAMTPTRYPMEFETEDFWRGAGCAWCCFVALLVVVPACIAIAAEAATTEYDLGMTVMMIATLATLGAIVAGIALLCFFPLVWWAAKRMRRISSIPVQLTAYASLGALIGAAATLLMAWWFFGAPPALALAQPWSWVLIAISAASVMVGWSRAAWKAHHDRPAQHEANSR